jgi:hypothetical protein
MKIYIHVEAREAASNLFRRFHVAACTQMGRQNLMF